MFNGNPILFLGLGMGENDLLRPLRQFVSNRDPHSQEAPIFALMPKPGPNEAIELRRYLYERFGVKTLYYECEHGKDPTGPFCDEIDKIAADKTRWWEDWEMKPSIKDPIFNLSHEEQLMIHHRVERTPIFDQSKDEEKLLECLENLVVKQTDNRVSSVKRNRITERNFGDKLGFGKIVKRFSGRSNTPDKLTGKVILLVGPD